MFKSTSMLGLVGALVSASAYSPAEATTSAPGGTQAPVQAMAELRRARVELYCSHDALAVANIRAAREHLRRYASPLLGDAMTMLDQAAWLVRHGHLEAAEEALQHAIARLEADDAQA
jgi:hypothetical protein